MATQIGNSHFDLHHEFDERVDAFKAGVKKLVDRAKAKGESNRVRWFFDKTGETIKAHPYAAIGVGLGVGYLVMRIVRR